MKKRIQVCVQIRCPIDENVERFIDQVTSPVGGKHRLSDMTKDWMDVVAFDERDGRRAVLIYDRTSGKPDDQETRKYAIREFRCGHLELPEGFHLFGRKRALSAFSQGLGLFGLAFPFSSELLWADAMRLEVLGSMQNQYCPENVKTRLWFKSDNGDSPTWKDVSRVQDVGHGVTVDLVTGEVGDVTEAKDAPKETRGRGAPMRKCGICGTPRHVAKKFCPNVSCINSRTLERNGITSE